MEDLIHVSIYVLAGVGAICLLFVAWLMFEDSWNEIRVAKMLKKQHSEAENVAGKIADAHWWFGGMPQVFNALFLVQYHLREYGHIDAGRIRDRVIELGEEKYTNLTKVQLNSWILTGKP